jgi:hypothetical protein
MKEVVAIIRKSDTAEIRVSRSSWHGRQTIDVRVWFIPKGGDEFVPSRKGVTIDAGKCDELINALKALS